MNCVADLVLNKSPTIKHEIDELIDADESTYNYMYECYLYGHQDGIGKYFILEEPYEHELMVELLGIFSRIRMDAIKELEG